jgi:Ca2+-binding RTX toxin-like protein
MDLSGTDVVHLVALDGNDRIDASGLVTGPVGLLLDAGAGDDTVVGGASADTIASRDGDDSVTGGGGIDHVYLGVGDDVFGWASGDGSDHVAGKAGFDTLDFEGGDVAETFTLSEPEGQILLSLDIGAILMRLDGMERIDIDALGGEDLVDGRRLDASSVILNMDGGAGDDTIYGGAGADTLSGGEGNDSIAGGAGGDVFGWVPNDGSDTLDGQTGFDTLDLTGDDIAEKFTISGPGGRVDLSRDVGTVELDLTSVELISIDALGGDDIVDANMLFGDSVALDVDAGSGEDTVLSGGGSDTLAGGSGNDSMIAGSGDDSTTGGVGNDAIDGEHGNDTLAGGAGNDTMTGGAGANTFLVENDPGAAADRITDFSLRSDSSLILSGYTRAQYDSASITNAYTDLGDASVAEATIRVGGDTILLIDGAGQGFVAGSDLVALDSTLGNALNLLL